MSRDGDASDTPNAFDYLYENLEEFLSYIESWDVMSGDADDLVQEVGTALLGTGSKKNPRAFVYTCVKNAIIDVHRRRGREIPLDPDVAAQVLPDGRESPRQRGGGTTPASDEVSRQLDVRIDEAFAILEKSDREVMTIYQQYAYLGHEVAVAWTLDDLVDEGLKQKEEDVRRALQSVQTATRKRFPEADREELRARVNEELANDKWRGLRRRLNELRNAATQRHYVARRRFDWVCRLFTAAQTGDCESIVRDVAGGSERPRDVIVMVQRIEDVGPRNGLRLPDETIRSLLKTVASVMRERHRHFKRNGSADDPASVTRREIILRSKYGTTGNHPRENTEVVKDLAKRDGLNLDDRENPEVRSALSKLADEVRWTLWEAHRDHLAELDDAGLNMYERICGLDSELGSTGEVS